MGSLGGHLIPGSFFIIIAIWWSIITAIRYFQSNLKSTFKKNGRVGYRGTATMPCICLPSSKLRRAPIESYLKLIGGLIGCGIETVYGFNRVPIVTHGPTEHNHEHHHDHKRSMENMTIDQIDYTWQFARGNLQHITMYFSFSFGAFIEILLHNGANLPKDLDCICGILAFTIEAFLFAFHLHGKEVVEVYVHVLLVYAIVGCIICAILETYNRKQILFTYGRILFTFLQGTWFWHVGFLLYPPWDIPALKWDLSDHSSIMTITVSYCWHVLLIFFFLIAELFLINCICFKSDKYLLQLDELIIIDNANKNRVNSNQRNNSYDQTNSSETRLMVLNSDLDDDISDDENITFSSRGLIVK